MTTIAVFAPARVNLIGEHTDYSGGFVLPVAVDLGVSVRGRPDASSIRLRSQAFGDTVEVGCDGAPRGGARRLGVDTRPLSPSCWGSAAARPPASTARSTRPCRSGRASRRPPRSTSPSPSLSARAAVFELPPLELARVCQEAERLGVGVPCGLMDPATALLARRGHALLLDCATEEYRHVPLPAGLAIVVLDSGVRHALEHPADAARRAELERGLKALGGRRPADVTPAEADDAARPRVWTTSPGVASGTSSPRTSVSAAASRRSRPRRARPPSARRAVPSGAREPPRRLRGLHPELDLLVELAYEHGAVAARMTAAASAARSSRSSRSAGRRSSPPP